MERDMEVKASTNKSREDVPGKALNLHIPASTMAISRGRGYAFLLVDRYLWVEFLWISILAIVEIRGFQMNTVLLGEIVL
jgi:hypothetical protein